MAHIIYIKEKVWLGISISEGGETEKFHKTNVTFIIFKVSKAGNKNDHSLAACKIHSI